MKPGRPSPRRDRLAEGIRRLGFRRWYQRELLSGHANLVLLLLSTVGVMACLELMSSLRGLDRLLNALYATVCAGVGAWSLRRYLAVLLWAEAAANQANCPQCGTYGRLTVESVDPAQDQIQVQCRRCHAQWPIETD